MGLTKASTGSKLSKNEIIAYKKSADQILVGVAGNPNVGKSTLFNNLTGMHQHTGNWPGKTVSSAIGEMKIDDKNYLLIDLPGTYSLLTHSKEEDVARDFICFSSSDMTLVVCDATCLERNLNLCLQITEMTDNVVVAVNLLDEAERKGIEVDLDKLACILNVPVIGVTASKKKSIYDFKNSLSKIKINEKSRLVKYPSVVQESIECIVSSLEKYDCFPFSKRWLAVNLITNQKEITEKIFEFFSLDLLSDSEITKGIKNAEKVMARFGVDTSAFSDKVASAIVKESEKIAESVVTYRKESKRDYKIDKLLTGKITGFPLMIALLMLIFWITITFANYPSELLNKMFSVGEKYLLHFFGKIGFSDVITDVIVCGIYRVLTWVIAVMLPPMPGFKKNHKSENA